MVSHSSELPSFELPSFTYFALFVFPLLNCHSNSPCPPSAEEQRDSSLPPWSGLPQCSYHGVGKEDFVGFMNVTYTPVSWMPFLSSPAVT